MALRLVEAFVPTDQEGALDEALRDLDVQGVWKEPVDGQDGALLLVRVLVEVEESDAVVGALMERFEGVDRFQAVILNVEASVPAPEEEEDDESGGRSARERRRKKGPEGLFRTERVSIEELLAQVRDMSRLTRVYLAMVALATIVAAIGLLEDNVAVVIGSMVIAPLLGPIVAVSLAATLADWTLGRQAVATNAAALSLSFGLAFVIGLIFAVDPEASEIARRTRISLWDVLLGLAVGGAGVLSVTTGVSTALVGVMVAVALLPPLVVLGLLVGSGQWNDALVAGTLLLTYALAINLSAVLVFVAQGVRPRQRWEAERARRAIWIASATWILLLVGLAGLIHFTLG